MAKRKSYPDGTRRLIEALRARGFTRKVSRKGIQGFLTALKRLLKTGRVIETPLGYFRVYKCKQTRALKLGRIVVIPKRPLSVSLRSTHLEERSK